MPNDVFTGGASSSTPNDWSSANWDADNPPTATDTVEQTGAATIDSGSYAIGGLQLDTGADLAIGSGHSLNVSGSTDNVFGGAGTTIEVGGDLTVGSAVTSANGTVTVDAEGHYTYDGSGSTQSVTINPLGEFDLTGSNNDESITSSAASTLVISGPSEGGVLNLASGGTVFMASQYAGTIENLSSSGAIALYLGHSLNGTPTSYTLNTGANSVTFNFSTSSGPVSETLTFASSTPVSTLNIGQDFAGGGFGISVAAPTDTLTGGTGGSTVAFGTSTAWSGGLPTPGDAIAINGAAALDSTTNAGSIEVVAGLTLASGATLSVPTGTGLYVTDSSENAVGGAGSTISVSGEYVVGVFATSVTGDVDVGDHGDYILNGAGMTGTVSVATGGDFVMQGWSNAGTVALNGGEFVFNGSLGGANDTTAVNMSGGGIFLDKGDQFNGVISNFGSNGEVFVNDAVGGGGNGGTPTTFAVDTASNSITFDFSSGDSYTLDFNSSTDPVSNLTVVTGSSEFVVTAVCFCSGTRIKTTRGEVAVEDLAAGDLAVTSSGEARPIVWIGSRTIVRPSPEQWPVRVMAGAFGDNRPARDLFLSPGHAVCLNIIEEVFVPVGELVNNATIAAVEVDEVTYWHVELQSHDVLLAEGMGCESYMDAGNRGWFWGGDGVADPERIEASLEAYARPFVNDPASIEAIRRRLSTLAGGLGWTQTADVDLHLLVDGTRVDPVIDGDAACFAFRADAANIKLLSQTFSPAWTGASGDRRRLGVMVSGLRLADGFELNREIPLDTLPGFHPEETAAGASWRWTDGALELPAQLWAGGRGLMLLRLTTDPNSSWAWRAPDTAGEAKVLRFRGA